MLSGSINGTQNTNYTRTALKQGDQLLDLDIVGIFCNAFIDVWSHKVNISTQTYSGDAYGVCNISSNDKYTNLPLNVDMAQEEIYLMDLHQGFLYLVQLTLFLALFLLIAQLIIREP
jgi:hypothetical protein